MIAFSFTIHLFCFSRFFLVGSGNASALFLFLAPVYVLLRWFFVCMNFRLKVCLVFDIYCISFFSFRMCGLVRFWVKILTNCVFYRITFKRIIVNKSTEKFSGLPYVMTLLNCLLSAWWASFCFQSTTFHIITYILTRAVFQGV